MRIAWLTVSKDGAGLQDQKQPQGHQKFFIRVFPKKEKQHRQEQHIPGIHMIQMELIQNVL